MTFYKRASCRSYDAFVGIRVKNVKAQLLEVCKLFIPPPAWNILTDSTATTVDLSSTHFGAVAPVHHANANSRCANRYCISR